MASTEADDLLSQKGQQVGLEPAIISDLLTAGWTADSFAHVVSSPDGFETIWSELFPLQDLSLLQKSGIRALWSKLREPQVVASEASGSKSESQSLPDNSWSDVFPPKLSSSVISNLKQSFLASYPSEVLTNETCPSTRLRSLVYHHVQKKDIRWIPWKYRLSISKADDQAIQRAPKIARAENLQLHQLLLDEPPSVEISNQSMGLNTIRMMFELHNYAWALAGGAHLHRLRAFSLRFMSLLTQRLDAESGLRPPSILEAQSADKHLWHLIQELCVDQGWSLNDALHEFTVQRSDMSALLQPRLKMPKAPPVVHYGDHKGSKGGGKGPKGSKGAKGGSKGDHKGPRWIAEAWIKGQRKPICMRFQNNNCNLGSNCKFAHICANPTEKHVGAIIVLVIMIRLLTDQRSFTTVSHHQFNFLPIRMDFQLAFHHWMVHLSMERTLFQRPLTHCM